MSNINVNVNINVKKYFVKPKEIQRRKHAAKQSTKTCSAEPKKSSTKDNPVSDLDRWCWGGGLET